MSAQYNAPQNAQGRPYGEQYGSQGNPNAMQQESQQPRGSTPRGQQQEYTRPQSMGNLDYSLQNNAGDQWRQPGQGFQGGSGQFLNVSQQGPQGGQMTRQGEQGGQYQAGYNMQNQNYSGANYNQPVSNLGVSSANQPSQQFYDAQRNQANVGDQYLGQRTSIAAGQGGLNQSSSRFDYQPNVPYQLDRSSLSGNRYSSMGELPSRIGEFREIPGQIGFGERICTEHVTEPHITKITQYESAETIPIDIYNAMILGSLQGGPSQPYSHVRY